MKKVTAAIALAAALGAAGCLQKDTTHTIYLAPDGRATWLAVEKDVRSDEQETVKRANEEQRYLLAARSGTHGVGVGLAALEPARIRTHVVRGERPFVVVTEAEFSSVENAVRSMALQLWLPADVSLTEEAGVTTLRVRIDTLVASQQDGPHTPVINLLEDADRYRFVLTEGRFTGAKGFDLRENDTVAVPIEQSQEAIDATGGVVELTLSWKR